MPTFILSVSREREQGKNVSIVNHCHMDAADGATDDITLTTTALITTTTKTLSVSLNVIFRTIPWPIFCLVAMMNGNAKRTR